MKISDLRRRIENDPTIFGAAGYCAHCGHNLMCAPRDSLDPQQISHTWKFCFSECRNCGKLNPAIDIDTFTLSAWQDGSWEKKRRKKK